METGPVKQLQKDKNIGTCLFSPSCGGRKAKEMYCTLRKYVVSFCQIIGHVFLLVFRHHYCLFSLFFPSQYESRKFRVSNNGRIKALRPMVVEKESLSEWVVRGGKSTNLFLSDGDNHHQVECFRSLLLDLRGFYQRFGYQQYGSQSLNKEAVVV